MGGGIEIGGTPAQRKKRGSQRVHDPATRDACGHAAWIGREHRHVAIPAVRQFPAQPALQLARQVRKFATVGR